MHVEIPFSPHWAQWEVIKDEHRFKVLVCGRRTGKSFLCVNLLVYYALRYPGKYWYCAPTYKQAKEVAWDMLKAAMPKELIVSTHESELVMKLVTGGVIALKGVDNRETLRGSGLSGVVLDEFQDYDSDLFPLVIRPMLSDFKGFTLFAGTPKGKGNVLYQEYIKDKEYNDKEYKTEDNKGVAWNPEYKSFHFHTKDNPFISEQEIEAAKEQMTEDHFKQEYEAEFVNYTGLIFKEFKENEHCEAVTKESIVKHNIYIGIDTGEYTAAEFLAYSHDGVWRVFDEVYAVDQTVKEICKRLKDKLADWNLNPEKVSFIIDSASQHKREYMANGIYVIDCEKDTLSQIDMMKELFKNGKIRVDKTACANLVSQLKGYIWDERKNKKKGRQPKKTNDHAIDAARYIIGSSMIAKPFEKKGYEDISERDVSDIERRLGLLSDDFERWEDEHQIDYNGNRGYYSERSTDPVTGYN